MYIDRANVFATFFRNADDRNKDTDRVVYGTLSVSNKVGENQYENDYYKAYFVGNACQLARELGERQLIWIDKMKIRNRYVKEKGKNYVSVTIFEFRIAETGDNYEEDIPGSDPADITG